MRNFTLTALSLGFGLLSWVGCDPSVVSDKDISTESAALIARPRVAVLKNAAGGTVARVLFAQFGQGRALVTTTVNFPGARAGFHGAHIHANDNPANGVGCVADPAQPATTHFVSADGHFNPGGATHGNHGGDTPGILILDDGSAASSYVDEIDLNAIVGRAVVLHEGMDNFGNIPVTPTGGDPAAFPNAYTPNSPAAVTLTQNTGNAGTRIGCGVIQ